MSLILLPIGWAQTPVVVPTPSVTPKPKRFDPLMTQNENDRLLWTIPSTLKALEGRIDSYLTSPLSCSESDEDPRERILPKDEFVKGFFQCELFGIQDKQEVGKPYIVQWGRALTPQSEPSGEGVLDVQRMECRLDFPRDDSMLFGRLAVGKTDYKQYRSVRDLEIDRDRVSPFEPSLASESNMELTCRAEVGPEFKFLDGYCYGQLKAGVEGSSWGLDASSGIAGAEIGVRNYLKDSSAPSPFQGELLTGFECRQFGDSDRSSLFFVGANLGYVVSDYCSIQFSALGGLPFSEKTDSISIHPALAGVNEDDPFLRIGFEMVITFGGRGRR